jgi:hypothetical protein
MLTPKDKMPDLYYNGYFFHEKYVKGQKASALLIRVRRVGAERMDQ